VGTSLAGVALAMLTPLHEDYGPGAWRAHLRTASKLLHSAHRRDAELAQRGAVAADGATNSPLERLERLLEPYSSFLVVPLFALANAGLSLQAGTAHSSLTSSVALGVVLGRLVGKPIGILVASRLAVHSGLVSLPGGVRWRQMAGIGMLGGVGFTVALYVNDLAFKDASLVDEGKIGIMAAAIASGLFAYLLLRPTTHGAEETGGRPREPGYS